MSRLVIVDDIYLSILADYTIYICVDLLCDIYLSKLAAVDYIYLSRLAVVEDIYLSRLAIVDAY